MSADTQAGKFLRSCAQSCCEAVCVKMIRIDSDYNKA